MSEDEQKFNPETTREQAVGRLAALTAELGFHATPEMEQLAADYDSPESIAKWRDLAGIVTNTNPEKTRFKIQIGLLVEQARVLLAGGNVDGFLESLDDIIYYADLVGLEKIADELHEIRKSLKT